jgi:hypothetical protein
VQQYRQADNTITNCLIKQWLTTSLQTKQANHMVPLRPSFTMTHLGLGILPGSGIVVGIGRLAFLAAYPKET